MCFGCRLPVAVVSHGHIPGMPRYVLATLHIILSNEGDAVYIDRYLCVLLLNLYGKVLDMYFPIKVVTDFQY